MLCSLISPQVRSWPLIKLSKTKRDNGFQSNSQWYHLHVTNCYNRKSLFQLRLTIHVCCFRWLTANKINSIYIRRQNICSLQSLHTHFYKGWNSSSNASNVSILQPQVLMHCPLASWAPVHSWGNCPHKMHDVCLTLATVFLSDHEFHLNWRLKAPWGRQEELEWMNKDCKQKTNGRLSVNLDNYPFIG